MAINTHFGGAPFSRPDVFQYERLLDHEWMDSEAVYAFNMGREKLCHPL